jgi:Flp pilus assembly protein TadD
MPCRWVPASLSLVLGTLLITTPAVAQYRDPRQGSPNFSANPFDNPTTGGFGTGRITGTVRTADGHVVSNAKIEVHEVGRRSTFLSVRSDSSGSFALYNISPGNYEVTASNGIEEAHQRVEVGQMSGVSSVDFRLANKAGGSGPESGSTVSLSQFSVPAKARALYEKAHQSMDHGKLDDALSKVNAALAICPKFPEALTLRGMLQADAGKRDEAIADYRQAIQYDANYANAYLALASLYNSTGRFDESRTILGQAERIAPDAWQTYFELARANLGKGRFAEALRDADRSSELQGGPQKEVPALHLVRGYALIGLTEMPKAAHEFETFLAREPRGELADRARTILDKLRATTITASQ